MADSNSRAGKRYDDESIRGYLEGLHGPHDEALEQAFRAPEAHDIPAIMVSPSDGRTLEILLRMIGAERVVEIGTLAGYSAIRMAHALPEGGRLWSIEYDPKHAEVARQAIAKAGLEDRVEVIVGDALEVLPTLEQHGPFDAVFVDADKERYHRYGAWAAEHLRTGGVLLGDNAYLFGNLMNDSESARAMRQFHEDAAVRFHSVCMPTPDGLLVGLKR